MISHIVVPRGCEFVVFYFQLICVIFSKRNTEGASASEMNCACVPCMHDSSITDGSSGAALCSENQSFLLKVNNNCKNSGGMKA